MTEIAPHLYRPSWLHMGDCAICGHVAESPLHTNPVITVCNPAPSPGPLWDAIEKSITRINGMTYDEYVAMLDGAFPSLGEPPKIRPAQPRDTVKRK